MQKKSKKKNKDFVKRNRCPYCTYPCDSATTIDKYENKPEVGDVSFCLMCCEPSTWDSNMKLIKFDLDSIPDLLERNRIKLLGMKVNTFWEDNPPDDGRRNMYLKLMDRRNKGKICS